MREWEGGRCWGEGGEREKRGKEEESEKERKIETVCVLIINQLILPPPPFSLLLSPSYLPSSFSLLPSPSTSLPPSPSSLLPPSSFLLPPSLFHRFKKAGERTEYIEAMKTLLPLIYQRMMAILPDASLPSVTLQHQMLKIFYATMQVCQSVPRFPKVYKCCSQFVEYCCVKSSLKE